MNAIENTACAPSSIHTAACSPTPQSFTPSSTVRASSTQPRDAANKSGHALPDSAPTWKGQSIETWLEYPPIPIRNFDYGATLSGYEPGDPIGWGPTKEAAIVDLKLELECRE